MMSGWTWWIIHLGPSREGLAGGGTNPSGSIFIGVMSMNWLLSLPRLDEGRCTSDGQGVGHV